MFSSEPKFPEQFICVGRAAQPFWELTPSIPLLLPFTAVTSPFSALILLPVGLFSVSSKTFLMVAKRGHEERRERWKQALQSWVTDFTLTNNTQSTQLCESPRTWLLAGHCEHPLLSRQISSPRSWPLFLSQSTRQPFYKTKEIKNDSGGYPF